MAHRRNGRPNGRLNGRPDGRPSELGAFLRARRDAVTPEDAGLAAGADRRVRGLRREEVALLAGVSTDYYRRLEQGREEHPSVQVLNALARALRMDAPATAYLIGLVHPAPHAKIREPNRMVSAGMHLILEQGLHVPALIVDPGLNILAMNPYATVLYDGFGQTDNLAHMVFLDPAGRDFYVDWDEVATQVVGNLRAGLTTFPDDRRITDVVDEISGCSAVFASLWDTYTVRPRTSEDKTFRHPELGVLHLHYESMEVADAPDQRLFVYCPYQDSTQIPAVPDRDSRATSSALS
ncbi:helix-turn-helix transcriptional regulator [Mycolicibacterium smegmatis]|uniref:helix-turn-helix transcriptional regulator n=1 Tax=Mycolicibacterium smegmatis TaxID=1772 RepID=UPI001EFBAD44|nr:helix-turn-helix transcriptional regulator [Mycolicibacterium smegmatis]ULN35335.1 helix-turn-helix transcriptional regulator [Mycolicibacterium smegmatis]